MLTYLKKIILGILMITPLIPASTKHLFKVANAAEAKTKEGHDKKDGHTSCE